MLRNLILRTHLNLPRIVYYNRHSLNGNFEVSCRFEPFRYLHVSSKSRPINFRIRRYETNFLFQESTLNQTNVELDDIELCLSDQNLVVNLTWLRDSCHCKECTHQFSRQRLFNVKDFRREKFKVKEVQLNSFTNQIITHLIPRKDFDDDQLLEVKWSDGHESKYSLNWLLYVDGLYKEPQLQISEKPDRIFQKYPNDNFYLPSSNTSFDTHNWNVKEFKSKLRPVDYHDLLDGCDLNSRVGANFINANKMSDLSQTRFEAMSSLTSQLVTLGLAKVVNVPPQRDMVLQVARSLAYERPTGYGVVFDVVVEPNEEKNLAYSSMEFDLHTDLPYRETSPGVQLLHCIRNSMEGGLSYFSDSYNAAHQLQLAEPILFEVLLQIPITYSVRDPYRDMKLRRHQPTINVDLRGHLSDVLYSPFTLPPLGFRDDVKLFYLAMDNFTRILQARENKLIDKMEPGDLFIFHNRRVLHGRSAYDARNSNRFLQGCYMDWDEITSLYEKLHSHQDVKLLLS